MKYRFETEQMNYIANFLATLAHGNGVAREQRRAMMRLANKFAPPRWNVDLKPIEKAQVLQFTHMGLQIMANKLDEEGLKEEDKAHIEKVSGIILAVIDKLEGNAPALQMEEKVEIKEESNGNA